MAKQKTPNYSFFRLGAVAVVTCSVLGLFISTSWAQTWQEPGVSPTSGNVAGPIFNQNVSAQTPTASPFSNFWISGSGTLSTVNLKGSASGTFTVQTPAAAGTYTLVLPNTAPTAGQVLSVSSYAAPTITTGWSTVSGGAQTPWASNINAANYTLSNLRTLTMTGSTSGTLTIQTAAAAGTYTLVLPNTAPTAGQVLSVSTYSAPTITTAWAAAGVQTPWASAINAASYSLTGLGTNLTAAAGLTIASTGAALAINPGSGALTSTATSFTLGGSATIYGGSAASGTLTLHSTSNATKGYVILNPTGGNVGIGNTAPGATLSLGTASTRTGTLSFAHASNAYTVTLTPSASTAATYTLTLPTSVGSANQVLANSGTAGVLTWTTISGGGNMSCGGTCTTSRIPKFSSGTGIIDSLIYDTGTNIGIGTTSPTYKLDVGLFGSQSATAGAAGLIRNGTAADTTPYTQARMVVYGGTGVDTTNWGYFGYGSDAIMRIVYAKTASAAGQLSFGTTSATDGTGTYTEMMRMTNSGSVGIGGITSPAQKLDVNGYIRASSGFCISGTCITSWPSGGGGTITGSGTTGKIPKFTSSTALGDSIITDNGSTVAVSGALTASTSASAAVKATTSSVGSAAFSSGGGYYGLYVPETASPVAQYGVWTYGELYGLYGYSYSNGTGVYGLNNTSGSSGSGVEGYAAGSGDGVSGTSHDGYGVYGTSTNGAYGFYTPKSSYVGNYLAVGTTPSFTPAAGDIVASRGASSGVVFLGANGGHYLYYDGTNYQMPTSPLNVPGGYYGPFGVMMSVPGYTHTPILTQSWNGSGDVVVLTSAGNGPDTNQLALYGNPAVGAYFSSNVYANGVLLTSDRSLKENITPLDDNYGIDIVKRLKPVSYNWKDKAQLQTTQYGFIAQDVQKLLPNLVAKNAEKGTLELNYNGLLAPMVKAIQEQQKEIEDLQTRIKKLEQQVKQ